MITKRTDAQIFLYTHKIPEYPLKNNSLFTPVQVGTSLRGEKICEISDNDIKDNISKYNHFFLETTGTYYIWKQLENNVFNYDFIGQCQYRRILPIKENINFYKLFKKIDFIAVPIYLKDTVLTQYSNAHFKQNLLEIGDIIYNLYPEYYNTYVNVLNNHLLFYAQGFIFRKEHYIEFCKFLFDILMVFFNNHQLYDNNKLYEFVSSLINNRLSNDPFAFDMRNFDDILQYQKAMGSFLTERIFTVFVKYHFKRYLNNIQYVSPENINEINSNPLKRDYFKL